MNKRKAFTLIELLVVIAIIALLMAILMPTLRSAKNQAKAVICKSNLNQWGKIFYLYTHDNDSKLKGLWDLKWHRTYNMVDQAPLWPDWMVNLPDP